MAVIPFLSFHLEKVQLMRLIGILLIIALLIELLRRIIPGVNTRFTAMFGAMLRDSENDKLTGATYLLIAAFFSFWLFELWIAQVVMFFVIISDGLSALMGKWIGKHHCFKNKTWEGNAVFVFTAILIILLHPECPLFIGLVGVLIAFLADILSFRLDDNWTIPISSGLIMQLVAWLSV